MTRARRGNGLVALSGVSTSQGRFPGFSGGGFSTGSLGRGWSRTAKMPARTSTARARTGPFDQPLLLRRRRRGRGAVTFPPASRSENGESAETCATDCALNLIWSKATTFGSSNSSDCAAIHGGIGEPLLFLRLERLPIGPE